MEPREPRFAVPFTVWLASAGFLLVAVAVVTSFVWKPAPPPPVPPCTGIAWPDLKALDRLRDAGKYDALEKQLAAYQRRYAQSPACETRLWIAFGAERNGDESARASFDRWVAARPTSWLARTARGMFWVRIAYQRRGGKTIGETSASQVAGMRRALAHAAIDLQKAIELNPRCMVAYGGMIDRDRAYGDTEKALHVYRKALHADPATFEVRFHMLLTAQPKWGGSTELMDKIIFDAQDHLSENPRLRRLRAWPYATRGADLWYERHYPGAIRSYRRALEYWPERYDWRVGMARLLLYTGHKEQALRDAKTVVAQAPHDAEGHVVAGKALLQLRRFPEALAEAKTALAIDSTNGEAWEVRALALVGLRRWENAAKAYAAAAEHADDSSSKTWRLREEGKILEQRLGKPDQAETVLREAIRVQPDEAWNWAVLADVLVDHHRPGRRAALQRFLALADPAKPEYRRGITAARAYLKAHPKPTGTPAKTARSSPHN